MTRRSAALQLVLALLFCHVALAQQTGTFTPTGNMTTARNGHTATLLLNGKVLITGGYGPAHPGLASTELFNPDTGTFTASGDMTTPRIGQTATLLPDGRVLIAGGSWQGLLATAELYDPATGIFTPTGNMVGAQIGHTAILLNNGKVLISGGRSEGTGLVPGDARAELYDPSTGVFSPVEIAGLGSKAAPLSDGKILIAGGPRTSNATLYDPTTNTVEALGFLAPPHTVGLHTATLLPTGKVLIAGGLNEEYDFWEPSELYDPGVGTFQNTQSPLIARYNHTATVLLGGLVLIAGGSDALTAELFDPYTETFRLTGSMASLHKNNTATLLRNGSVLITGGDTTVAELYVPPVLVPAQIVTDLRFDRTSVVTGSSFSVSVSGSNLTPQTFFDVRFTSPGNNNSDVVLNWQRGLEVSHDVADGTVAGSYTIINVRAHEVESDHTGIFFPVSAKLTVSGQHSDAVMNPGDFLLPGQSRHSADGRFRLVYQVDGNLVLYQGSTPLWWTGTQSANPGIAVMQTDGNFVVYDSTGPVWWSRTWAPGAFLVIQDDGNTVIYSTVSSPLWATHTCCR